MLMGYLLYREVLAFAPDTWTPAELVVALVIADDARDETRISTLPRPELCRRARLQPDSVRHVLQRLARSGYEFRVGHGPGRDGREVRAVRGHATDFRVPDFAMLPLIPPPAPVDNWRRGGPQPASAGRLSSGKAASRGRKGGLTRPERRPHEAGKAASGGPPFPSVPLTTHTPMEADVINSNVEGPPAALPDGPDGMSPIEAQAWAAASRAAARRREGAVA